jgi:hypothetical protein
LGQNWAGIIGYWGGGFGLFGLTPTHHYVIVWSASAGGFGEWLGFNGASSIDDIGIFLEAGRSLFNNAADLHKSPLF